MFTQLNYLAILVAAIVALVIGFVYYLPPLFGLRWATLVKSYTGLTDADLNPNLVLTVGRWLVTCLVNAVVLAALIGATGTTEVLSGIALAVIAWAGLGATFSAWPPIFAKQPWGIWLINNGAYLLMQVVMAAILTLWR